MQPAKLKAGYGMTLSACLWFGLFPLLQGGTYAHITHDKWSIMLALSGVTLLCFLFDLATGRLSHFLPGGKRSFRSFIPLVPAAALLLWTVLSCLVSSFDPDTWFRGAAVRYEGLISQLCYFFLFFCFFFSHIRLKPVLLSAAAGVLVFFIIVLLQRAGGNPLGLYPSGRSYAQNPEFQGTIGNIDMGTGYLLLLAGLFLYALLQFFPKFSSSSSRSGSIHLLPVAIAFLITLWLIITMDVQFGVISLAVLALVTFLRFLPGKYRLLVFILLIIIVLLAVWFWPGHSGGLWELHEVLHGRTQLSFGSNRLAVWYYSLLLSGESLLTGGGSGTFRTRFNEFLLKNDLKIPTEQDGKALPDYFDTPHNEYISQLTDHGLPALILFVLLLLLSVFRKRDGLLPLLTPCSAAVLCYAVQAFFAFSVCIVAPMFWILIALSFGE